MALAATVVARTLPRGGWAALPTNGTQVCCPENMSRLSPRVHVAACERPSGQVTTCHVHIIDQIRRCMSDGAQRLIWLEVGWEMLGTD